MVEANYEAWIGRSETAEDIAAVGPLNRLAALLDHESPLWPPATLPPLAHWLYFLSSSRQSLIDKDGHPQRGGLLPMVPLPRRMWAGSRLEFLQPIFVGSSISRRSTVQGIVAKSGKSGNMVFVTLLHEVFANQTLAVREEQDIVYREAVSGLQTNAPVAPSAPAPYDYMRQVEPDPVLLFRFSAITFNSHRIHYDRDYACNEEGYKGLVVHGPLIATLLMDHYLRHHPAGHVAKFSFRALRPLFDTASFGLFSKDDETGTELWAAEAAMPVAMTARLESGRD